MTEEFDLSEKRRFDRAIEQAEYPKTPYHYIEEDVKEFIKKLKEDIMLPRNCDVWTALAKIRERIDKLAGSELVGKLSLDVDEIERINLEIKKRFEASQ